MPTKAPKCPWCAKPMSYMHTAASTDHSARKHRYECRRCIVLYEELDRDTERTPDRATRLHREPLQTLQ